MPREAANAQRLHSPSGREGVFPDASAVHTILLLGSGALKIGEAGEFDYSGSQAIKAFKAAGKRVILVNPNIATHQTNEGLADEVYFIPVQPRFVEQVIVRERPDAIALSFGGQTALNCGVALHRSGALERHGVRVLGTPIAAIEKTEDRALFNQELAAIGVPVPRSFPCTTREEALQRAEEIGYPVIVRGAYALGGKGSGVARGAEELKVILDRIFVESPQALVEENLTGWKEVEYEVVRDSHGNCITVCNMENVDPMGIHTGESIVVAPSQTLDNADYHILRTTAIRVVQHLGIVGECNIQYALDPSSRAFHVIEVNARLSRSSALASKATGYPLAAVAASLTLGRSLPELRNALTGATSADFEPALDYVAVKVPRWDLQKFRHVSDQVTSEMKSVGEVMALGRTFEEALQKALRMVNIGAEGLYPVPCSFRSLAAELKRPTPRRIFAVAEALRGEWTVDEVHIATGIDRWFLERVRHCAGVASQLLHQRMEGLSPSLLRQAKRAGFSDRALASIVGSNEEKVRARRLFLGVTPFLRQIDTLAGEFPAVTNYLYFTYHGSQHDVTFAGREQAASDARSATSAEHSRESARSSKPWALVLGGGTYSIGSSVEFDWCCTETAYELKRQGYAVAMINSNPETVSTDYDECDTLVFDELSLERVLDLTTLLRPVGVVVSMGGQIPNSLALPLVRAGVPILGTRPEDIDRSEDRHKFSALLDALGVDQPVWREFTDLTAAWRFAAEVGYPVIVRPSYVLSGATMAVVHSAEDLEAYLQAAATVSREAPVVVSKFEQGAKEIDFDAVAQEGTILLYAVGEHLENAGVHSGDATIVLPPERIYLETLRRIKVIAKKIAAALRISGPFNIQLLAKSNAIKVIECNLRASRSFPFASKVTRVNFASLATQALLGRAPLGVRYETFDRDFVGVKAAQFSFSRLHGADPRLGVEMASTGEVACFGETFDEAFLLSLLAVGFQLPRKNILVTVGKLEDKVDLLPTFTALHRLGYVLFATERTHAFLESRGIPSVLLSKVSEPRHPNIREYLSKQRLDLVINIPQHATTMERTDGYTIRRLAVDHGIPLITNVQLVKRLVEAMENVTVDDLRVKPWSAFQS